MNVTFLATKSMLVAIVTLCGALLTGSQAPAIPKEPPAVSGKAPSELSVLLNVRGASFPGFSPDGLRLAFIRATDRRPQLWVGPLKEGSPIQITTGDLSVFGGLPPSWSPRGDWIACERRAEGMERAGLQLVSPDGRRQQMLIHPKVAFVQWGGWSPDGRRLAFSSTERNGTDYDVYVVDIDDSGQVGAPRRVFEGDDATYVAAWRPDGKALLLSRPTSWSDVEVLLLNLVSGRSEKLFGGPGLASYRSFAWTPEGRGFYLITNQDRDLATLSYYNTQNRTLRVVEAPPFEVDAAALAHDARYLAWTTNESGFSALHVRDLKARRLLSIPAQLPRGVYRIRWAGQSSRLAIHVAGPTTPGEVWTFDVTSHALERIPVSTVRTIDEKQLIAPEAVRFASWDGETIYGLLYVPRGASELEPAPVLLHVHGGNANQARPMYDGFFQYLVARGIAVLDLNYRGSTGYGKRFERLDNGRLRPHSVKDIIAALDGVRSKSAVDSGRTAIMGASYGGYLALAALVEAPDRFRGAVVRSGVSSWVTALERANPRQRPRDRIEYGSVEDKEYRQFFSEISPLTRARNIRGPLLVQHGRNDEAVPFDEALQLVEAIRRDGGQVEFQSFPDEGHNFSAWGQQNRLVALGRAAAFLEESLGLRR